MKEIAPGVYVESSYPPYNLVVIDTEKGGIIVDIPPNPVHAVTWFEQARGTVGKLRYAVLTDAMRERQLATATCDMPMIASEGMLRVMETYDDERPRRDWLEDLASRYPEEAEAIDSLRPRKPGLAFSESFTLYGERRDLVFETVAGAGPGSLWLLIPDEGILIAGDIVVGSTVPLMAETPDSKAWLNTMTALAHRHDVKMIIPGRGDAPISLGDIEPQREFMRVMRRAARTLARRDADSLSLSQTSQELGQTFFNQQGPKAVKQIKAGLEHLVAEVVAAQGEDTESDEDEE
ncbi:MAG: hypothetical protein ACP5HS_13945 [Anaerolineae bacterium]